MPLKHFNSNRINKMFIVVEQKLSFQIIPVLAILSTDMPFFVNTTKSHHCPCDSHLPLNLCIEGMGHFQLTLSINVLTTEVGIRASLQWSHKKLCFGAFRFKQTKWFCGACVDDFSIWRAGQVWLFFINNKATSKYLNRHLSDVHLFHISMNCFRFIFYAMTCMSGFVHLCLRTN